MTDLHWSTLVGIAFVASLLGAAVMWLIQEARCARLQSKLFVSHTERDRLQLACDTYEKALEGRNDQIVELAAEIVILRNSGNVPPEAA